MVMIKFSEHELLETKARSLALLVPEEQEFSKDIKLLAQELFPQLETYIKEQEFHAKLGSVLAVPVSREKDILTLFLVGLGKKQKRKERGIEHMRRALGTLIKTLQSRKIETCGMHMPPASYFKVDDEYLAKQVGIIAQLAAYRFDDYITDGERKVVKNIMLDWIIKPGVIKNMQKGLAQANIVAASVNRVRHWVDLPPSTLTPTDLSEKAKAIAKEHKLGITIFDEEKIKQMGMGGLAAVAAGSEQDCKLVIMDYKAAKKTAPTIVLVGKGITFDSGGLSIKPAKHMETMKEDMSGAAAVIGTMQAIAQLKPKVNVIGVTPLAENLPSGAAAKPGDIVRFYNGKTAEIKNTDAEGRLILADALSYAVKEYKPDAIIDIATLTGACQVALGPFFTGIMGFDDALLKHIEEAAQISGERVWRLPFDTDFKKAIISDVADICNIGKPNYMAGAITAGFFLSNFVDDTPWVHMDIAGTAFDVPDISYYSPGATGVGVRLFIELLMHWE